MCVLPGWQMNVTLNERDLKRERTKLLVEIAQAMVPLAGALARGGG